MFKTKMSSFKIAGLAVVTPLIIAGCGNDIENPDGGNNSNSGEADADTDESEDNAGGSDAEVVIELAEHPLPLYQSSVEAFTEYINENADGEISVSTFTFPELGSEEEIVEMVSIGEIDMYTAIADGGTASLMPSSQVTGLPFSIQNHEQLEDLMAGEFFEDLQTAMMEESGNTIRPLGFMKSSIRHLYTTEGPIITPDDLQEYGISMRVQEAPLHVNLWEELGTDTTSLPADERYQALQTGMIDGTEGALMSAWEAGLMEVQDYVTLTGHQYGVASYGMNEDFYNSLSEEHQEILHGAVEAAIEREHEAIPESDEEALNLMEEEGIEITELSDEQLQEWQDIAIPVGQEFLEEEVADGLIDDMLSQLEQ